MTWNSDVHGQVFKAKEIKLYKDGAHTWAMKLSQLAKQSGRVRIVTYSLPDIDYAKKQIGRRPRDLFIVCHEKFKDQAEQLKRAFPDVQIAVNERVHSKVCLIAPETVYIGSANFGLSRYHETEVGIRSEEAHDWYVENSFNPLWDSSKKIPPATPGT